MSRCALVAVKIPPVERVDLDDNIDKLIRSMGFDDEYIAKLYDACYTISSLFARIASDAADEVLCKYDMYTIDVFKDCTDKIIYEYESDKLINDCIQWSNGLIERCPWYFAVINGVLVEVNKGKCKTFMRSHKAKRARYVGDLPIMKVYKSPDDYAYTEYNYVKNKDTGEIGFWNNSGRLFDFYLIGNACRDAFIIDSNVDEYVFSDKNMSSKIIEDGDRKYRAAVGCRKKDLNIEATEMLSSDPFDYSLIIDDSGTFIDLLDESKETAVSRVKEYIKSLDDDYVILDVWLHS